MAEASYSITNFLAGEWSPFFQGRTEHPRYKSAMNVCRNGLPLEEGTWVRRPGSRLKAPTYQNKPARIYPVAFTISEPYDVEFSDGWLRFFSGHKLVYTTDGPQTVTAISTANPAVITLSAAVTWATDDEIYFTFDAAHSSGALPLRQRCFLVTKLTTTTFSLRDGLTLANIDGSTLAVPAGATITASRVLRVASPYVSGSWSTNRIAQNQDLGLILNGSYAPYILTIAAGTNAGTASATMQKTQMVDGPYLDPVNNSQIAFTGGTLTGPAAYDISKSYPEGSVVESGGLYYLYGPPANSGLPYTAPPGYSPPATAWHLVSSSGAGAGIDGSVTITVSFVAWDATHVYNIGDYVSHSGANYQSLLQGNFNQNPATATTYWSVVAAGTEVTGPFIKNGQSAGFLSTDVGRHIRLWSEPPKWDPTIAYHSGDIVTYDNTVYLNGSANVSEEVNLIPGMATNLLGNTLDVVGIGGGLSGPGLTWTPQTSGLYAKWTHGVITAVTSATVATMLVEGTPIPIYDPTVSTPVTVPEPATLWRFGVFSDSTSYPTCGSFYEGRFWFGGAVANRFDTSQSQGFDKNGAILMAPTLDDGTVTDACGISYTFESRDANEIVWLEPDHNGIMCGTAGGEWLIQASTLSDPITPTSIQAKRVTKYGCANIEPRRTGISLVFIQKFRRRVMEFLADVFTGRYVAPHLNEAAKHLATDGIAEIGYQEELAPVLWARTGDLPSNTSSVSTVVTQSDTALDPIYTNSLSRLTNSNLTYDGTPTWVGIGVAIDLDAKKVWYYNPWYGGWNVSAPGAQNPATGVGGLAYVETGALYPALAVVAASGTDGNYTLNAGATTFARPIPAGFVAWGSATTWDPATINTGNITLSGGNLTADGSGSSPFNWNDVKATTGKSTGKWYFEITINAVGHSNIGFMTAACTSLNLTNPGSFGIDDGGTAWRLTGGGGGTYSFVTAASNPSFLWRYSLGNTGKSTGKWVYEFTINAMTGVGASNLGAGIINHATVLGGETGASIGTDLNGIAVQSNGSVWHNGSLGAGSPGFVSGNTFMIAVDLDAQKFWFYDPAVSKWNFDVIGNQNPATGTGGFSFSGMTYPAYPAVEVNFWNTADQITVNFGATAFSNTMPAGFEPWGTITENVVTTTAYTHPTGDLIGATYRRVSAFTSEAPAFVGWHRHDLGHTRKPISMGVGPIGDGELDSLDMVTTDGTNYYVEGLTQIFDEDDAITDSWFVDGALVPDSAYEDTSGGKTGIRFTGLWYLVGKTVAVVAFGLDLGDFTVDANGTVFVAYGSGTAPASFDYTAAGAGAYLFTASFITANLLTAAGRNEAVPYSSKYMPCCVGYTFISQGQIVRPNSPEQSGAREGPAFGKKRRSAWVMALLHNTLGLQLGTDFTNNIDKQFLHDEGDVLTVPTDMYSGIWRNSVSNDYSYDSMLSWQIVRPYPASVVSIGAIIKTQDA